MSTSPGSPSPGTRPIWVRPEPGTRRARFSREQIAAAALAIADAEGFEAVSMRRIAAQLGAGTMSLYRYISTKDDLVTLMDDALMGESLVPEGELPATHELVTGSYPSPAAPWSPEETNTLWPCAAAC